MSTTTSKGGPSRRKRPSIPQIVVVIIALIVLIGTGTAYLVAASGPTNYACMSLVHRGSDAVMKTTGLVHYLKSQYYVTCTEGSNLPTGVLSFSCLTITPQAVAAPIGVGATTYYYYLSAPGNSIAIQGAPTPTNGTEIITPSGISVVVTCA